MIAPEVGGGFGSKIHHYPDEAIAAWCAIKLNRPVKWTATRSETNLTDAHGRDHWSFAELALDGQGKILGLRVKTHAAMGAYLSTFAPAVPTYLYGTLMSGQYDIPAIFVRSIGVFTHTTPVDAYRGAGRPEATFVVERLMDLGAHELGLDPVEIRRRNFVAADAFPYQTQVALQYDSGNYEPALDKALATVGYHALRAEQASRRASGGGKLLGIGIVELHRGLRPRVAGGRLARRPGRPVGKRQGAGPPHRHGFGLLRLVEPRPGPQDRLRPDRLRPPRHSLRKHRGLPGRHPGGALRHGHLRQPLGGGRRQRHRQGASTR